MRGETRRQGAGGRDQYSVFSGRSARSVLMALFVASVVVSFGCNAASASPLDTLMEAFTKAPVQTEAAVANILKTGLQENRPAEALAMVKQWLDANPAASQASQFYAGLSMQYAGEWPGAVTFYRKLLKNKSLDAKLAGTLVPSTYRLLISDMREPESAYLLMREDGDRLRSYGNAKQFDSWFMAEAKRRNDVPAVCGRFGAILATSSTNDVVNTADLEWVCSRLESFQLEDEDWYAAAFKLAAAPRVPARYKARIAWAASIPPCNKQVAELILARKDVPDELFVKPLQAAAALIAADPYEGSMLAARGWMAFNERDTPTFLRMVAPQHEAKVAPLLKAIRTLPPEKARTVLSLNVAEARGRSITALFSADDMRGLVNSVPALFNSLTAPDVPLFDQTLTQQDAKALVPNLVRNPNIQAALVRAYAVTGTNTLSAMVPAIMKSERWRFDNAKAVADAVWNSGCQRDGDPQKLVSEFENQGPRYDQIKKLIAKEASSQDRMTAFKALFGELLGTSLSTPALLDLWDALFANAPDPDRASMLTMLTADLQGDREYLLKRAGLQCDFGGQKYAGLYMGPDYIENWFRWGCEPTRKALGGFAAHLQGMLQKQLQTGTISEPILGMWLYSVNPKQREALSLMSTLTASPVYTKIDPAYHALAAQRELFGSVALPPVMAATDPDSVSKELLALPAEASPAAVEAALKAVMARVNQASDPVTVYGLYSVAALPVLSGTTRALALSLFNQYAPISDYPSRQGYEQLGARLVQEFQKEKQWGSIVPYAACLWRCAGVPDDDRSPRIADALIGFSEAALAAGAPSSALSVARMGLKSGISALNPNASASQPRRGRVSQVAGKAAVAIGAVDIPVDETDPAYAIYKSNAEYVQENLESAWSLYKANEDQLQPIIRKLSLEYCFWLLRRNIEDGQSHQAELLVKELTIWSREAEGTFSLEQEANLKIAYADLAFLKGALPTARAWYRKVADAREYKDSEMYLRAALGSVKVDRVSKNFGTALEELDNLMRIKDPAARTRVHYARAEVMIDQENYKDAFDEIDSVLRSDPNHADALILRGSIQFQMRKLVEASEIELGVSQENKVMVPGEALKINLNDPTLSVSGVGADIEVEVWAKSGDRERVLLHQLGDSKDKFRADVPTALAPPVAGDKVLQVLGVDEIRYGYSTRFRAKMKDLPPDPGTVIGIASDAYLSLSAGAFPPREGERRLDIEELGLSTAQRTLGLRAVRPGNPIYIRVIDPDQSKTAGIDQLVVALQTSSGDEIRRLLLQETGPYTGEFEGIVMTAGAQAMAFASESAPGRDPNMTISAKAYPGWLGNVGDKERMRTFGVDMNDNIGLGTMIIISGGSEDALTGFVLQTSMNGREWTTRARYPENPAPWDGRPRVSSFPTYNGGIAVTSPKGNELPSDWIEKMELTSARASCRYLAETVSGLSTKTLPIVNTGHPGYTGLLQYRALFFQPAAAIRRFRLTGYPSENTVFLLDDVPADAASSDPLAIERELVPGLHEIQVWRHAGRDELEKSKPVLLCDVAGKEDLSPCPDSMFDPSTFPEGVRQLIPQPASIKKSADGGALEVTFGANTQARLVRLAILGFNGVAPLINTVRLSDREGNALLPVKDDFMALRQNSQLEVLPGDQITVRYEDEVTATPGRNKHEQRLQVAFNTATISASFLNYKTTTEGRVLQLEPIRRFKLDDAVAIVIDDADMDASPTPDTIDCKVVSSDGASITLKAVETEDHSGRFIGRVFPVAGKPARASEIQIAPGATLTAIYRDMENLDPGIPADRSVTIEHAKYATPQLGVFNVTSQLLPSPKVPAAVDPKEKSASAKQNHTRSTGAEVVVPRRSLAYTYLNETDSSGASLKGVIGASLRFDVVVPHLALAGSSEIAAYVQTRQKAAEGSKTGGTSGAASPFDVRLPGTLKLTARPAGVGATVPSGYTMGNAPSAPLNLNPLDEGRFSFTVPLILGDTPPRSFATQDAESLPSSAIPEGVAVRAGDVVKIGFAYKDDKDQVQWKTASIVVGSHTFLDVMTDGYNEALTRAFVGEKVFVRVLAPGLDRGADRDHASVALKGTSGATTTFLLRETESHSGVFKGVFSIAYADEELPPTLPPVELNGFPVRYGDDITVSYAAAGEDPAQSMTVSVNMGADGAVEPFSKRFAGDEMAVKTGFTLAECWFELAKKHREMDQESLARREMEHAQKLLAESISSHRDDEMRAHAEYLLGNLSQEYADLAKNDESKLPMYQDALARFSKIPVDYPETEFAPKAQFKTALVYEKMGESEIAVEEYVKLAYKYPDCEYIPEVMSRLGGYFQSKGQAYKEQADPLRENTDLESQAEVLRLDELSYPEFLKAALIFGKLFDRFPDHDLAGLAGLRSSQNYMRAHQYQKAIDGFKVVVDNETYDARDIRSQALYWSGLSYERLAASMTEDNYRCRGAAVQDAYQTYRRVTFDFPDSKWAKFARGRLADPVFARIIEEEEKARERLLETLQYERKRKR